MCEPCKNDCHAKAMEAVIQQRDKAVADELEADEHRHSLLARLKEADLQINEFRAKDKAFEDATVKNLEAVTELLEALTPFYFHAKALRSENILNLAPLKEISKVGVSALVGGAFLTVIEVFEKWGEIAGYLSDKPKEEILVCPHGAIHEIGWGICGKCQELGIPRRPERKPLIEKLGGPFLNLGEGEFINLYGQVVEKAKEILAEDNKTCGNNWPAGQAWEGLAGTSKSIFMTRARRVLGIDDAAFLYTVRNWPYSDTAQSQMEYLFES